MRLLGKKQPTGRQRILPAEEDQAPSFSYHAARRSEEETKLGRQAQRASENTDHKSFWRFWLQRSGLVILMAVIVLSVINILSLSSHAKIMPLNSSSNNAFLRNSSVYQAAADKLLYNSAWNHNKITIDTAKFNKQMTAQFPELSSVSVTLPLLAHRPVVYLQPTQPALILITGNGSYVIDTRGKALLLSTDLPSSHNNLPQVNDQSGLSVKLNRQVLTADDVNFIQTVIGQLAARHISVSSMDLPPAASELDAHISGQPYFVKFNLQNNDARQQAGTYLAVITQLQHQKVTPAHYVDVRVDGRAYYQ